jgi:acyl-coenzyme A synthetase/AMP-(fatty) acid ligase
VSLAPVSTSPLLQREQDSIIAHVAGTAAEFLPRSGQISVGQFISQVNAIASQLPARQFAINLCENRYSFLLAFCAVITRQQTNLLPSNRGEVTQQFLAQRYSDVYVLHDGTDVAAGLTQCDLRQLSFSSTVNFDIPQIANSHLAAIPFTSGSTGEPQPNLKTWHTFVRSTAINSRYMLPPSGPTLNALATVPGQHMWGLETSILIPMLNPVSVSHSKPLLPHDVLCELTALAEPRLLISTPLHLRALIMSGLHFPRVERILCATAPLTEELAADTERCFGGELHEVFGCSEVGSMAIRRARYTSTWNLFDGLTMGPQPTEPQKYSISADHLPIIVPLQDRIELLSTQQFRLLGRGNDMLEIAGKRGSLQEMNNLLLNAPGVRDGVIFLPAVETVAAAVQRVAAIVVFDDSGSKQSLLDYFRQRLDPVFLPRPVFVTSSLPREDNGKLPREKLDKLYRELRNKAD